MKIQVIAKSSDCLYYIEACHCYIAINSLLRCSSGHTSI